MAIEIVDFPIKNGDFPIKNGDFPIKNGDFPIKNGDFPTLKQLAQGPALHARSTLLRAVLALREGRHAAAEVAAWEAQPWRRWDGLS